MNGPHWARQVLTTRPLTIGGGTTDIQLNIIGERILGLPRDPEPPGCLSHRLPEPPSRLNTRPPEPPGRLEPPAALNPPAA